jgi:hypothetical protein
MCDTPRNTLEYGDAQEFLEQTFDFLYPVDVERVQCQLGLCPACPNANAFKCRYTENTVVLTSMDADAIANARLICASNNTCGIEPVGGEGGIIETPIRDDASAMNVVNRRAGRDTHIQNLANLRLLLILAAVLTACYLLS